jgi:F-type H+-transporting ATPase subunit a
MGLEFLARVRASSLWAGALVALLAATYGSPAHGLAMAAGTAWSLVNLALLQRLVVALTGPERTELMGLRRTATSLFGMLALFALGALLLRALPPASLLWGFLIPFAVLVLKAVSLIILGSSAWKRFKAGAGARGGRVALWILVPSVLTGLMSAPLSIAQDHGTPADTATTGAPHGAGPATGHPQTTDHSQPQATGHGAAHGASEGPQKFANVITILARAFPNERWAQFLHEFEVVFFSLFIALLLCLVAWLASRRASLVPGKLQNAVEMLVESLYGFIVGILGPHHGPRYVPFLGSLFLYILAMNLFGLIPFMDSPTSSLNVTVALAITVFIYAQAIGFRRLGVVGWFDHMLGNPRNLTQWLLAPLMLPIHIMGEFAKPISLAARLFGNVFGEDMLLVAFVSLGITTLAFSGLPLGLPLHLPFLFLALLTGVLQALVFTVLSTIYFLLMLPHEEHAEHAEGAPATH